MVQHFYNNLDVGLTPTTPFEMGSGSVNPNVSFRSRIDLQCKYKFQFISSKQMLSNFAVLVLMAAKKPILTKYPILYTSYLFHFIGNE